MQLSTSLRNARADVFESHIGAAAILKIFDGALPSNCATADAGTSLSSITLPSDWMAAASSGAASKSGTWEDTSADANGYGRYYRIYDSGGSTCHAQGLVSQAWAATTAYGLNQQVNNGGNVYRCTTAGTSAGSGGPTGTGSGITDGTAVWTYVGAVEMVLDNSSIAAGQKVTVASFTITEASA